MFAIKIDDTHKKHLHKNVLYLRQLLLSIKLKWLLALVLVLSGVAFLLVSMSRSANHHAMDVAFREAVLGGLIHERGVESLVLLVPVCASPVDLESVLDTIGRADGIEETVVVFSQESADGRISDALDAFVQSSRAKGVVRLQYSAPWDVFTHTIDHTSGNILFLLEFAFDYLSAPGVIMLDGDVEVSPDFLRFYQWSFDNILKAPEYRKKVLTVAAYSRNQHTQSVINWTNQKAPYTLHVWPFSPWGWSLSREIWSVIREDLPSWGDWSAKMNDISMRYQLFSLCPEITRTKPLSQLDKMVVDESRWEPHLNPIDMPNKASASLFKYDQEQPAIEGLHDIEFF